MKLFTKRRIMGVGIMLICLILVQACSTKGSPEINNSTGQPPADSSQSAGESMFNEPGMYPIVKEKQELNIMAPANATIADYNTLYSNQYFEDLTNVHINWTVAADLDSTKAVILASGDVPDIFLGCNITNEEQILYGGKGLFTDLSPYIDSAGFYIKQMFDYDLSVHPGITAPDGGIYSLPTYSRTAHMKSCNKMWINTEWLNKLNLKAPETLDDFYNMLVAFKSQDPNGNGLADEIPLSGFDVYGWNSCIPYIMSAFIVDDGDAIGQFVQPFDGTADVIFNKTEYQDGLRFLAKLYKEGLLDAETFTQDSALRTQKVAGDQVGACTSNAPSAFAPKDSPIFANYDPLAPVSGPNGLRRTAYFTGEADYNGGCYTVTSKCKDPELAFRWADVFYDVNQNAYSIIGEKDVNWRDATPNEIGINGLPAVWAAMQFDPSGAGNVAFNQVVMSFRPSEWRLGEVAAPADKFYTIEGQETRLYKAYELYLPYNGTVEDVFYPRLLYIDPQNADELATLKADIYKYVSDSTVAFITGSMNVDTDWDSYVGNLNGSLNLPRYLELIQSAIK